MKTIELDLERDNQLDTLSGMIKNQQINLGHESFHLKIHSIYEINQILYASLLLLLVKYFIEERNRSVHGQKPDIVSRKDDTYYAFYLKSYDVNKLENKIEKDFKVNIDIEKKSPLDEVFGIWKNEDITLENIREKAWQRTN
jgi:hypothetical protein